MPASDLPQAGSRFPYLIKPWRVLAGRARTVLSAPWIWLFAGLASIAFGQYLMEGRDTIGRHSVSAEILNAVYRLQIINYDNAYHAMPYFIFGIFVFLLAGTPPHWKINSNDRVIKWPEWNPKLSRSNLWNILAGTAIMAFLFIQLGKHQYASPYVVLWLIGLLLFTQIFWRWDKATNINLSPGVTTTDIFWMLILFTFGLAFSSFALQDHPITIIPDEGPFWETAQAIATRDYQPVPFDSGIYTFPIASSIYQAWVMRIFGISLWGWRFSSVLAAVATVIPLYLLAREWFDRRVGIVACVVMLANPYFLVFARLGYNNSQTLFPATFCIYLFAVSIRKGSMLYLWLTALTAGLAFYTYFAAWIGAATLLLGNIYLLIRRHTHWKSALAIISLLFLGWVVACAPRLAFIASGNHKEGLFFKIFESSFANAYYAQAYYTDAELTKSMPLVKATGNIMLFYDPMIYGELLARGVIRTFLVMFDPFIVNERFMTSSLAGVISPVFFLIGLALSLRNWKQIRFGLLLIWLFSGTILLSVIGAFPPQYTHLVSIIPVIALMTGIGLIGIMDRFKEYLPTNRTAFRSIMTNGLIGFILAITIYCGTIRYFVTVPKVYPPWFEDIVAWVAWRTEKPVEIVYVGDVNTTHRIEYLIDAHVIPHTYRSIDTKNFSPNTDLDPNTPTIVFYEAGPERNPAILYQSPKGYDTLTSYYYKGSVIIGFALTNTEVNLHPGSGLNNGLHSLTDTSIRYLLAGLLAATFAVTIIIKLQSSP
jgi:4-amino-4-deoxy-L-arabinose transferase-like glycosyltransferase